MQQYVEHRLDPSLQDRIWEILQDAIRKRKEEGSLQWQDGYPNPEVIADDLKKQVGSISYDTCERTLESCNFASKSRNTWTD